MHLHSSCIGQGSRLEEAGCTQPSILCLLSSWCGHSVKGVKFTSETRSTLFFQIYLEATNRHSCWATVGNWALQLIDWAIGFMGLDIVVAVVATILSHQLLLSYLKYIFIFYVYKIYIWLGDFQCIFYLRMCRFCKRMGALELEGSLWHLLS